MYNSEIIDKIRQVNGPVPELEPQIVKSRQLLTYYAGVLLRKSQDDYLTFCMTWDLPVDWMVSNSSEPLEPKEVAFTPEGQRLILSLTKEDYYHTTYGAELLNHLIKLGPESLTMPVKKKLFDLVQSDQMEVRGPSEWNPKSVSIRVPQLFLSLLRRGYFTAEDTKKGKKMADDMALKVIKAYYEFGKIIRAGGQIDSHGVDVLIASCSKHIADEFTTALKSTIGSQYHKLGSRASIAAINKLSGEEQRRAIEKYAEQVTNLLKSIP